MGFKKVDVKTLEMKPFEKIGSEWMLISAAKDGKANTMTASWGGIVSGIGESGIFIENLHLFWQKGCIFVYKELQFFYL